MTRHSLRRAAALVLLVLVAAACGNSGDETTTTTAEADGGSGDGGSSGDERNTFVEISGVPGVSDDEIAFTVIGTKAGNPLGTCILDCYAAGIEAYFAYRNAQGGIFGRELVLQDRLDDELAMNQQRALEVISAERSFGVFNATLLPSGWADLDEAGIPTFTWGIHAADAANRMNVFPSTVIRCADCIGRAASYLAQQAGATKAASLGYGVAPNSKVCAQGNDEGFARYAEETGVEPAYLNDELAYGLPNGIGPEVTKMKQLGVDVITACIDLNGMKTLAQELERQGMGDVTMLHPNTYNQEFVTEAGDLFEGDYVSVQFRPFEASAEGTAMTDFREWIEKQGDEPTELAVNGWINASQAFDGLLAAGPEFDQQAVINAINAMTQYTAGGLLEPVDWTKAHTPYTEATRDTDEGPECFSTVQVVDGIFEVVGDADAPWLCWPSVADPAWSEPEPTNFG